MLSVHASRYIIVDVNPAFRDHSSEILLVIEASGKVFEYSLMFPRNGDVQAILAYPSPPPAMAFPYKRNVAVLAGFFRARGIYLLPLPLRSGVTLQLIPPGSPDFTTIATSFRSLGQEPSMRNQFCESRRKDFIVFYEKYYGPCDGQSHVASEVEKDFSKFWLER
jgi:hypothetical protein